MRTVKGRRGDALADSTIASILKPLRACMGQAVREGLIPHNPTRDLRLAARQTVQDSEEEDVRVRLLFRFLAATGLRISELFALQWRHLALDGSSPHVKVRRAYVRGKLEPPKTRHGRRDVPLSPHLGRRASRVVHQTEWPRDEDLVFPKWLGHHSAAFTLETYIHLLSDERRAARAAGRGQQRGNIGTSRAG